MASELPPAVVPRLADDLVPAGDHLGDDPERCDAGVPRWATAARTLHAAAGRVVRRSSASCGAPLSAGGNFCRTTPYSRTGRRMVPCTGNAVDTGRVPTVAHMQQYHLSELFYRSQLVHVDNFALFPRL